MPTEQFLSLDELAVMLHRSRQTILNDRVKNPAAVPPALRLKGTKTLLWNREAVIEWLSSQVEDSAASAQRRGRPRKSA